MQTFCTLVHLRFHPMLRNPRESIIAVQLRQTNSQTWLHMEGGRLMLDARRKTTAAPLTDLSYASSDKWTCQIWNPATVAESGAHIRLQVPATSPAGTLDGARILLSTRWGRCARSLILARHASIMRRRQDTCCIGRAIQPSRWWLH